ncbi:MAG: DUF456 domain-containing protein [Ignavibacteria bacterium]|nr:DUF456 domain-containing protein [Ignavibacteria bacterium]MBT8382460.1 DUF456 domain-containing protein [Ignavibacteria bacterium]MBT8390255.1 DUF456 domain-containing protein [Ignavibacteria bacterium]NNJ52869.1 DUF456 domain-containing protein [Ignavibacteriaceae bacterium]NNL20548.1 DUF456 domain-containing protein [Ignavibacteriaceae bacterium]
MILEIILISFGLVIAIVGLIGCIVPGIPGPPLNLVSLVLLEISTGGTYSLSFYIIWGLITIATIVLDYVFPVFSAKKFKASNYGIWGSVIGMILGIIFFPPFGMVLGLLVGAIVGELVAGKKGIEATKVGLVTFFSSMLMIVFKFAVSAMMTYYFIKAAIDYLL